MNIRNWSLLLCFTILSIGVKGQSSQQKKKQANAMLQSDVMEKRASKLIADHVDVTKKGIVPDELAPLTYSTHEELLEEEALRFPADELYGSNWDTCWVNPFRSKDIKMPDTFTVDCSSFIIPIDNNLKVTSKYGPRRRRMHRGIDLKLQIGDTVRTAFSGKIRIKNFERKGYGNYLVIRHPNGLETIYGHLSKFLVSENQIVKAGQAIALGGNTGRSTGPHLHFETRFLGEAINPSEIIDFENGVPHQDYFVFHKSDYSRRNAYTSTSERIVYHRVRRGETLSKIARKYGTSINELCRLNGLKRSSKLRIGQSIRCGKAYVKAQKPTYEIEPVTAANRNTKAEQTGRAAAYHKVKANETLNSIAREYGTTVDALCKLNNLQSTTPLNVGQDICYRAAKPAMQQQQRAVTESTQQEEDEESIADNSDAEDDDLLNEDEDESITAAEVAEEKNIEAATVAPKKEVTPKKEVKESHTKVAAEKTIYHRVQRGETLNFIARKYGTTVDALCKLNGISRKSTIKAGQRLRCNSVEVASANTSKTSTAKKAATQKKATPSYHRIKKGETLGAIAQKHGVSITKLCEMNNIKKTTILKVGRSLRCS